MIRRFPRFSWWKSLRNVGKSGKYTWTMRPQKDYANGCVFKQVDQEQFAVYKVAESREATKKLADRLKSHLRRFSPVDTGNLRNRWQAVPIQGKLGFHIGFWNTAWYFKFAWHYYRGEIKQNKVFIRDFVEQAVDELIRGMPTKQAVPVRPKPAKPVKKKPVKPEKPKPVTKQTPKTLPKPRIEKTTEAPVLKTRKEIDTFVNDSKQSFKTWRQTLTKEQVELLGEYKTEGFEDINGFLRKSKKIDRSKQNAIKKEIAELKSIIDRKPLQQDVTVYRGFADPNLVKQYLKHGKQSLQGMSYSDPAFLSTSLDKRVIKQFVEDNVEKDNIAFTATIKLPKGTKAAYMDSIEGHGKVTKRKLPNESELLLNPNQKLKIVGVKERTEWVKPLFEPRRQIKVVELVMEVQ